MLWNCQLFTQVSTLAMCSCQWPKVIQTNVSTCILTVIDEAKENTEVQCDGASLGVPIGLMLTKDFTKG